jgi:hypothetical protein
VLAGCFAVVLSGGLAVLSRFFAVADGDPGGRAWDVTA